MEILPAKTATNCVIHPTGEIRVLLCFKAHFAPLIHAQLGIERIAVTGNGDWIPASAGMDMSCGRNQRLADHLLRGQASSNEFSARPDLIPAIRGVSPNGEQSA